MKKHYALILLFLLLFLSANAQDKKWSVEASYPIFLNSERITPDNGILDLGIKYVFNQNGSTHFGVGINGMLFTENQTGTGFLGDFDVDSRSFILQPKVYAQFRLKKIPKLAISTGIGYSLIFSSTKGTASDSNGNPFRLDLSDNDGGLNGFLGVSYDISEKWYIYTQFDYIYNFNDNVFPSHLYLLKVGIGFQF